MICMEYLYRKSGCVAKEVGARFVLRSRSGRDRKQFLPCPADSTFLDSGGEKLRPALGMTPKFEWVLVMTTALVLLATFAGAQVLKRPHEDQPSPDQNQSKINSKAPKHYPRAIGVVEFLPGGVTRLVPVALWIDDRFYDASLYGANPAPMAVEPDTVYEATNYGERLGLFTVTNPEELKGSWIAAGKWKPREALDEKLAQERAKQPKPKPPSVDDERPTLKRPGESGSTRGSSSGSSGSGSANSNGGGTTNPSGAAKSGTASSGTPSPAEEDPNRPTLKKPAQSTASSAPAPSSATPAAGASSSSSSAASPDEYDPNRPVLRRGKPEAQATPPHSTAASSLAPVANSTAQLGAMQKKAVLTSATVTRSFPAVSDAGPFETRSLLYSMNDEERASKAQQMSALALDEIRKFIAQRHTPGLPKAVAITNFDLRSYDLEFHNVPTIVFTATLPVAGAKAFRGGEFSYFVTVVAHEDINGAPIKIFSLVSDSNHLDAFPRLEIIDAVDADANGRGDLLFRQHSDTGISYSLYRVYPYDMQKIFEGGSGV